MCGGGISLKELSQRDAYFSENIIEQVQMGDIRGRSSVKHLFDNWLRPALQKISKKIYQSRHKINLLAHAYHDTTNQRISSILPTHHKEELLDIK